jgi:hypothetical protein
MKSPIFHHNNPFPPNDGVPMKKRKSVSIGGADSHDLIHLLLITRKLDLILSTLSQNDLFLIGYTRLINHPGPYVIFDKTLSDLVSYLNQFNFNKDTINPVKIGIIYSIISLGHCINLNYDECLQYFIQSWNLLIKQLIPNYNNNNNLLDKIEILNNLFILSFIYLNYDLLKYCDSTVSEFISNSIILNYLNDISYIIYSNLLDDEIMINLNLPLFWNIYLLLSDYLSVPPKIYPGLKFRKVTDGSNLIHERSQSSTSQNTPDINNNTNQSGTDLPHDDSNGSLGETLDDSLNSILRSSAKSCINSNISDFHKNIVISTLQNELKNLINGEEFLVFTTKNCLHNSIILVNKSFNIDVTSNNFPQIFSPTNSMDPTSLPRRSSTGSMTINNTATSSSVKLFALFKKNLIINSPSKFHELLQNYVFIPTNMYNWDLLSITTQEINIYYPINYLLATNSVSLSGNFQVGLFNFFNYKQNNVDINNNLAIVSFPIVFLAPYLNLKFLDLSSYNDHELTKINLLIFEWYLTMVKILLIIWDQNKLFEENYILQSLIYMVLDNKVSLVKLIETHQEPTGNNGIELFQFNQKWFLMLKMKFDSILDAWTDFIKFNFKANSQAINSISLLKLTVTQSVDNIVATEFNKYKDQSRGYSHNPASMNSTDSFIPPLIDNHRRSNSITLGILQHNSGIDVNGGITNIVTPLATPNANNSYLRQSASQTLNNPRFSGYSTYASQMPMIGSHDLHLPPILPKVDDKEDKVLKLMPGIQRST